MVSPQIPLQLQPPGPDRFDDYICGPNQAAVEALQSLQDRSGDSVFLSGAADTGKTHLLNAACVDLRAQGRPAWYIGLKGLPRDATAGLAGLQGLVCIDDIHVVVGDLQWEEALFHCFNEVRAEGGQVAVSSRDRLSALTFSLPDLASRIGWGLRFQLKPLDEQQRLEVLQARANKLDLELPKEVEQFLLRRISRDLGTMIEALEAIQQRALAEKRRITVPLARAALLNDLDSSAGSSENG